MTSQTAFKDMTLQYTFWNIATKYLISIKKIKKKALKWALNPNFLIFLQIEKKLSLEKLWSHFVTSSLSFKNQSLQLDF